MDEVKKVGKEGVVVNDAFQVLLTDPTYQAHEKSCTDETVFAYLIRLNPEGAEKTINGLKENNFVGCETKFHEKAEIMTMRQIMGEEIFQESLNDPHNGKYKLNEYNEVTFNKERVLVNNYRYAHGLAMLSEIELIQGVFKKSYGVELSKEAILATIPRFTKEVPLTLTLRDYVGMVIDSQLYDYRDDFQVDRERFVDEVRLAARYYTENGVDYSDEYKMMIENS